MTETTYFLLQVESSSESSPYCTLDEVAYRLGLHPELLERFLHLGLIDAAAQTGSGEMLFDSGVIPLVKRILRLRNDLGVNYAGIGVILELMSRLEALEARIEELEKTL